MKRQQEEEQSIEPQKKMPTLYKRSVVIMWDGIQYRHDMIVSEPDQVHVFEQSWVMDILTRMLVTANPATRFEIRVERSNERTD